MIAWLNQPLLYFFSQLHNILSQMSPSDISSYLSANILTIGISSLTPMIYLSMDTIKCASNADRTQYVCDQCSGILYPQVSICIFLLTMMVVKILVAPLSTTTVTTNHLIKLTPPDASSPKAPSSASPSSSTSTSLPIWKRGTHPIAFMALHSQPFSSPSYY